MRTTSKENTIFIVLFVCMVAIIFRDVAVLKLTFIKADYLQQFFPWAHFYSESIKHFRLPFWMSSVQCGFPLFAEGQVGALYPLNLIFFIALPFKAAYNYSFLFHFILTGIFTYRYARKLNADVWGGAVSALLLCFGSVYAGCFVNIAALKSLTWFPAVLLVYETYLDKKNWALLPVIGLLTGMQFLSGAFQMTFYAVMFYFVYFWCRGAQEGRGLIYVIKDMCVVLAVAVMVGLPQLAATYDISRLSNRPFRTVEFALWDSFSPFALTGSFLPYLGAVFSKGNLMYVGITGLFFAAFSSSALWRDKHIKALLLVFAFSLFLALGGYNPLYAVLIKAFKFYTFRAPLRAIYFGVFALAVLGGVGFSAFFEGREKVSAALYKSFMAILGVIIVLLLAVKQIFVFWGPAILEAAKKYVTDNIYGKTSHRFSLDFYMKKTEGFYQNIVNVISFSDPYTITALVMIALAAVLLSFIYFSRGMPARVKALKYAAVLFICAELSMLSVISKWMRPELAPFNHARPEQKKIFEALKSDKGVFRIMPFGPQADIPSWLKPSMNDYYGLESVALYSPLANRDYFLFMQDTGVVDDSVGVVPPEKEALYNRMDDLRYLNVKYIISTSELASKSLEHVMTERGLYLYKLKDYLPRVFFANSLKGGAFPAAGIKAACYGQGSAEIALDSKEDGYFVLSEKFYPGWEAAIDGKETPVLRYMDVLQVVKVPKGEHDIMVRYRPKNMNIFLAIQALAYLFVVVVFMRRTRGRRHFLSS